MTLKTIVDAAAAGLSQAVGPVEKDVAPARRDLLAQADAASAALDRDGFDHPWLTDASAESVGFSPTTADGQPLLMNGKSTTFWAKADAAAAMRAFGDAVRDGAFDDQLASGGEPTVTPKIEGEQTPDDPENGSLSTGGGRTRTDETETRFTENLDNRLRNGND